MSKKRTQSDSPHNTNEAQPVSASIETETAHTVESLLHEPSICHIEQEKPGSELHQSRAVLEASRNHYLNLYDNAPAGCLTLDRDAVIRDINLAGAALLGVDRTYPFEHSFANWVAPEDRECWSRHFRQAMQQDGKLRFGLTLRRSDDSRFPAYLDCQQMKMGDRLPLLHIAVTDITGQKRIEEELRIAAVAFESHEGIIVTDAKGVIMRANHAFTRESGYSEDELVGKTPAMLNSGRQGRDFYENMWATLKQKHLWQGEIWNRRKNGKIYAEWLSVSAVAAPDGSITHYVGTYSNITSDPEASAEIHRLAYYDTLTRLPNRRLLLDRLEQALAGSHRSGRHGALLFMDLDNFKKLNDTRGHDIGDLLLIGIADRLNANVRWDDAEVRLGDMLVRLGGDEFVLMLENLSSNAQEAALQAERVAEKIREGITAPFMLDGVEYVCTVSIGVALFLGYREPIENLFKYADLAMYHAKRGGRDRVSFFDPAMQVRLIEHSELENDLRHALERKQLHLYYQIQIDNEHRVVGAEALLRWSHPERGLICPDEFIPLAEETGLIVPIGLWVLQQACNQLRLWAKKPSTRELQLSINVSMRQFHQPDFVAQVRQALDETGINPALLKIELTESLVLNDVSDTITKMHALKALGVSFSMDDFGTGYSSLSNLQQLPLNQLKIDRSFIRDLETNPNDAAIVQAIVTMGLAFGLNVIAEGVETEAQRAFLECHGCHAFQGYLFDKPMPIRKFEQALRQYA